MIIPSRHYVITAALVLVAFALRLAWIAYADFAPTLSDDAGRYNLLGRSLAEGGGYINPNGTTTMFWPPGYPFILAAVYKAWPAAAFGDHGLTAALVLNAVMSSATVALVYVIGRRAFGNAAALIGAVIVACFPSLILLSGITLTETAFTFFAMLAIALLVEAEVRDRRWLLVLAALVFGYATLIRGQALLFGVAAVPFWVMALRARADEYRRVAGAHVESIGYRRWNAVRGAMLRAVAVSVLAVAVVAPWTVRNFIESDALVLISSNDGVNFYIGHSPGADGRGRKVDELVFRYPDRPQAEAEAQISRDGFREGIEYALDHPLREVELAARKLFFLYWRDDEALRWTEAHGEREFLSSRTRDALLALSNLDYWLVLACAGAGVIALAWPRSREMGQHAADEEDGPEGPSLQIATAQRPAVQLLLLSLVVYWTLVHMAFFADPRFHAPVLPIIALFAGAAIVRIYRAITLREKAPQV